MSSCLALPNDMDALPITPRSKEHTLQFTKTFDLAEAWNNYGMVRDVKVTTYTIDNLCKVSVKY
jgi:hypothetical protein